jgi:hypothetical protein
LLAVAAACVVARGGHPGIAPALFWAGLLAQFVPAAARLLNPAVARCERMQVSLLLGVGLLLAHQMAELWQFNQFDELLHLRTLHDIQATGRLFTPHPLLPVSPRFPGLELVTNSLVQLTHAPDQVAGLVVLVVARVLLVSGIFLLTERVTRSSYAGGIGVVIYTCSPQFFFFNAQFAYQTLAIAFAVLLLVMVGRRRAGGPAAATLMIATGVALTLTHHVTSWEIVLTLAVCAAVAGFRGDRPSRRHLTASTLVGLAIVGAWLLASGPMLGNYLGPVLRDAVDQLTGIATGGGGARKVSTDSAGGRTPLWEQAFILLSLLIWAATLLPLRPLRARPDPEGNRAALYRVLRFMHIAYPVTLLATVAPQAAEMTVRLSTLMFIGISTVIGYATAAYLWPRPLPVRRMTLAVGVVAFVGGTMLGSGPGWNRLPGPYLVGADGRAIDGYAINAARFASTDLPPGSRFAADRETGDLLAATGQQWVVTGIGSGVNTGPIYFATTIGTGERALLRQGHIDYIVVDSRMADGPPHETYYTENGEAPEGTRLTREELGKFDRTPGCVRVYDNGPIRIYNVRALQAGPTTSAGRP